MFDNSRFLHDEMRRLSFLRNPHDNPATLGHAGHACALRKSCWLKIHKVDSLTGEPLLGAVFALEDPNGVTLLRDSNEQGRALFPVTPCVPYLLNEITPPFGYLPNPATHVIVMDHCGRLLVDGHCMSRLVIPNERIFHGGGFTAIKVNVLTGQPLSGAEFTLWAGNQPIASTVSMDAGEISFGGLMPGTYRLLETAAPSEYQPAEPFTVVVDENGYTTINGQPADGYLLGNIPVFDVAFYKVAADTAEGLPGATFEISIGGAVIASAVSGPNGLVDLGAIAPGTYQLTETMAPEGYQPDPTVHTVVITQDGTITVDGAPLSLFVVSNQPAQFPYTVFYYADAISPANLLGTIAGVGGLGEFINADLTLFAPVDYQTPGMRSGAMFISADPANNAVYVVYTQIPTALLNWTVSYYADNLSPQDLIATLAMPPVEAGTVITLTEEQLNMFRPTGYDPGVQIGGPVAITIDGQDIVVLYQA